MDSMQVNKLLTKYWDGETSLEEERDLISYFKDPAHKQADPEAADWFKYLATQQEKEFTGKTDIHMARAKKRPKTMRFNTSYLLRIAAGLAVVGAAWFLVQQELRTSNTDDIVDTYSDPKLAYEETKKALMLISRNMHTARKKVSKVNLFNEAQERIKQKKKNTHLKTDIN